MINIFCIILIICISLIYILSVYYKINKRIFFYEDILDNNVYDVKTKENGQVCINELKIIKVHQNNSITEYADITFNGELYKKISFSDIYNIVHECNTINDIFNILNNKKGAN